jgi:hypothetical protein
MIPRLSRYDRSGQCERFWQQAERSAEGVYAVHIIFGMPPAVSRASRFAIARDIASDFAITATHVNQVEINELIAGVYIGRLSYSANPFVIRRGNCSIIGFAPRRIQPRQKPG